jgi:hypothetical protein
LKHLEPEAKHSGYWVIEFGFWFTLFWYKDACITSRRNYIIMLYLFYYTLFGNETQFCVLPLIFCHLQLRPCKYKSRQPGKNPQNHKINSQCYPHVDAKQRLSFPCLLILVFWGEITQTGLSSYVFYFIFKSIGKIIIKYMNLCIIYHQ